MHRVKNGAFGLARFQNLAPFHCITNPPREIFFLFYFFQIKKAPRRVLRNVHAIVVRYYARFIQVDSANSFQVLGDILRKSAHLRTIRKLISLSLADFSSMKSTIS